MKGISTFVAVLITVLITVAVGLLIYGWATGYLRGTTQTAGETQEEIIKCAKANLDIDFSKNGSGKINLIVINIGSVDLGYNFSVKAEYTDGSLDVKTVNFTQSVAPGQMRTTTVDLTTGKEIKRVSLIPLDTCTFLVFSKDKTISI